MKRIATAFLAVLLSSPAVMAAAAAKTALVTPAPAATAKTLSQKLDLNRASREELVGVPGIGPRMAEAIIDLRTKKGSFKRIEELLEVTGIKEKKLAAIAEYLEIAALQAATSTAPAPPSR